MERELARPAGLEPATSWFVVVTTIVDAAQLTALEDPNRPATWTQSWTQRLPVADPIVTLLTVRGPQEFAKR